LCGIFGWVKKAQSHSETEIESAKKALSSLQHRGPDSSGIWKQSSIFIGHQRLKIIDLSDNAKQPFVDQSGAHILSFNGEIYNYLELRADLEKEGQVFRSQSDTEVLLHLLSRLGTDSLQKLDGMFAGSFYDCNKRSLVLFRDPIGQKPLYYYLYDGGIIYSSELRALLEIKGFNWKIDKSNFDKFLTHSYYPWDSTPIEGIRKLKPGHFLLYKEGKVILQDWWKSIPGRESLKIDSEEAIVQLIDLFDHSCSNSLRSDVPIGVFLSGGIDSTLTMNSCLKKNEDIKSFHLSMSESDFNEGEKAKIVSQRLKQGNSHEYIMNPDIMDQNFREVIKKMDEPNGDPGFLNVYFLSKQCRDKITVALAGDGADELFAGYLPFLGLPYEKFMTHLPGSLGSMIKCVGDFIPARDTYMDFRSKLSSYLNGFPSNPLNRHSLWLSSLDSRLLRKLLPDRQKDWLDPNSENSVYTIPEEIRDDFLRLDPYNRMLFFYQKIFLPEFVCHHTDRAAMLNSFEVRAPFLGAKVIKFANSLPTNMKVRGKTLKWILKEICKRDNFPRKIFAQKKQGFALPIARWMKGKLLPHLQELKTSDSYESNLVNRDCLESLIDNHINNRSNFSRILYNFLVFSAWRKKYPNLSFS
tara:strand:- start:10349 stop:12262 length:1914 start_codon:yes stop_codon:yes gene_type:complete